MRATRFLSGSVAGVAAFLAGCSGEETDRVIPSMEPTYSGGVARLLHENCSTCHRPGGAAPFPLLTYDQAREHGRRIARATRAREMPPWKPSRPVGAFVDERGLSAPRQKQAPPLVLLEVTGDRRHRSR